METEELRLRIMEVIEYDPETGMFRWRNNNKGMARKGWFLPPVHTGGRRRLHVAEYRHDAASVAWLIHTGEWPENRVRERDQSSGLVFSNLFRLTMKPDGDESDEHFRKRVMEVIEYEKTTGMFRWKVRISSRAKFEWKKGTLSGHGYRSFQIFGSEIPAHNLAWLIEKGKFPDHEIDHINGKRADNRIENLRDVTHAVNCRNSCMFSHNKSGICGVSFDTSRKKWMAHIKVDGKLINLGRFTKIEDAAAVRKNAEALYGFSEQHGKIR